MMIQSKTLKARRGTVLPGLLAAVALTLTLGFSPSPALAKTVLITGSSTGHGLAFVKDYADRGWDVIATCRSPDKAERLQAFAAERDNVVIEELDIVDYAEVDALAAKYEGTAIDVLNLNGAINTFRFGPNKFGEIDYEWFEQIMKVNVIGQLYVAEAFLEHIAASEEKKIIAMSSNGGSIANLAGSRGGGAAPSYRASKAALNMLMRVYGEAVKERGVIVAVFAPGTIDTEDYMNAEDPSTVPDQYKRMIAVGALDPRHAIGNMIDMINDLTVDDIDGYHHWNGENLPW
jgi:NAD(P)-dependent dehydrogenase (short-subunit alcohol dehydrogenase family)